MNLFGLDKAGRKATDHFIFTLVSPINSLLEVKEVNPIKVRTQTLGTDAKRLNTYHTLHFADTVQAPANIVRDVASESVPPHQSPGRCALPSPALCCRLSYLCMCRKKLQSLVSRLLFSPQSLAIMTNPPMSPLFF